MRVLLLVALVLLTGCGRKWEQLWGQDTKPEIRYIPMSPDQIEVPVGALNPVQYASPTRIQNSRYLSVWACTSDNTCVSIPEDRPEGDEMTVYVVTEGYILSVYNVQTTYPTVTKLKIQTVR